MRRSADVRLLSLCLGGKKRGICEIRGKKKGHLSLFHNGGREPLASGMLFSSSRGKKVVAHLLLGRALLPITLRGKEKSDLLAGGRPLSNKKRKRRGPPFQKACMRIILNLSPPSGEEEKEKGERPALLSSLFYLPEKKIVAGHLLSSTSRTMRK